jgi:hypothetical protein
MIDAGLRTQRRWSGREDLNLRLPAPKAGALPGCATPRADGGCSVSRLAEAQS